MKNSPFLSEDEDVRNAFVYLLLLRNPLIYRISVLNNKRCFLYEVNKFAYCNSTNGKHGYVSENGFHAETETGELMICGIKIVLHEPDTISRTAPIPIADCIGDGKNVGHLSLIQIYYIYYRILRRALNYTDNTEDL